MDEELTRSGVREALQSYVAPWVSAGLVSGVAVNTLTDIDPNCLSDFPCDGSVHGPGFRPEQRQAQLDPRPRRAGGAAAADHALPAE
jgi:hypothetical protein